MPLLKNKLSRRIMVAERRLPLSLEQRDLQIQRGLYTVHRGERLAIPVDRLDEPERFLDRDLWRFSNEYGVHRAGVVFEVNTGQWQRRLLEWARDNVSPDAPYVYHRLTHGHDIHSSVRAALFGYHHHAGWTNPFMPEVLDEPLDHSFETAPWHPGHVARRTQACEFHAIRGGFSRTCVECSAVSEPIDEWRVRAKLQNWGSYGGFTEALGLLNMGLMTQAFDSEIVDELVSATATEFADFDFHEVGTSSAAESNAHTALTTSTGIARATGTPADEDPDYANDATITADATESFEEHGLFNNSTSVAMMDRNLTGGQAVNASDQVTYQGTWTFNPET